MENLKTKKVANEILFYFQLIAGIIFGVSQIIHMLNNSTQGLSISMFSFTLVYLLINWTLSLSSDRRAPSKITKQILINTTLGFIIYFLFVLILFIKAESFWSQNDSVTSLSVVIFLIILIIKSNQNKRKLLDPINKGVISLIFKSTPQLFLAIKVFKEGGDGLNITMLIIFHLLVLARIYQIISSTKEAKWEKNRKSLLISEIGNEFTWILVTIAKFL